MRFFVLVFITFAAFRANAEATVEIFAQRDGVSCTKTNQYTDVDGSAAFSCLSGNGQAAASGYLSYSIHDTGVHVGGATEGSNLGLVDYYLSASAGFARFAYMTGGTGLGAARFGMVASSSYGQAGVNINGVTTTSFDTGFDEPILFAFNEIFQISVYAFDFLAPNSAPNTARSVASFSLPTDIRDSVGELVPGARLVFVDGIGDPEPVPEPGTLTGIGLSAIVLLSQIRKRLP